MPGSPENIQARNSIWIEQVVFKNTYLYMYIHAVTINSKESQELEGELGRIYGRGLFGGRNGKI